MDLTEIGVIVTTRGRPSRQEVDGPLQRAEDLVKRWERSILMQLSRVSSMESEGDTQGALLGHRILRALVRSHGFALERLLRLMREEMVTAMVAALASPDALATEAWTTFALMDGDLQKACVDHARRQNRHTEPRISVAADVLDAMQEIVNLHSTPLHSTPLHSTPLHSTPLHSTPLLTSPIPSSLSKAA